MIYPTLLSRRCVSRFDLRILRALTLLSSATPSCPLISYFCFLFSYFCFSSSSVSGIPTLLSSATPSCPLSPVRATHSALHCTLHTAHCIAHQVTHRQQQCKHKHCILYSAPHCTAICTQATAVQTQTL